MTRVSMLGGALTAALLVGCGAAEPDRVMSARQAVVTALAPPPGGGKITALEHMGNMLYFGGDVSGVMSLNESTGVYANLSRGLGARQVCDLAATLPTAGRQYLFAATTSGVYRRGLLGLASSFEHLELPGASDADLFYPPSLCTPSSTVILCRGVGRATVPEQGFTYAVQSVAVNPHHPNQIWAGLGSGYTDKDPPGGYRSNAYWVLFRSVDAGDHWEGVLSLQLDPAVGGAGTTSRVGPTVWDIAFDDQPGRDRVYVATDMGLYVSDNASAASVDGVAWQEIGESGPPNILPLTDVTVSPPGAPLVTKRLRVASNPRTTCPTTTPSDLPVHCLTPTAYVHPIVRNVGTSYVGGTVTITVTLLDPGGCTSPSPDCPTDSGVYQSTDFGAHWVRVVGLPTEFGYTIPDTTTWAIGSVQYSGLAVSPINPTRIAVTSYNYHNPGGSSLYLHDASWPGWISPNSVDSSLRLETHHGHSAMWEMLTNDTGRSWKVVARDWPSMSFYHGNTRTVEITSQRFPLVSTPTFELVHPFEDVIDAVSGATITPTDPRFWDDTSAVHHFHRTFGPSTLVSDTRIVSAAGGAAHVTGFSDAGLMITEDRGITWARLAPLDPATPINRDEVNQLAAGVNTLFAALSGGAEPGIPGRLVYASRAAPRMWSTGTINDALDVDVTTSATGDVAYVATSHGLVSVDSSMAEAVVCPGEARLVTVATAPTGAKLVWFYARDSSSSPYQIRRYNIATGGCEVLYELVAGADLSMLRALGAEVFVGFAADPSLYGRLIHFSATASASEITGSTSADLDVLVKSSAYTSRTTASGSVTATAETYMAPRDIIEVPGTPRRLLLSLTSIGNRHPYDVPAQILTTTAPATGAPYTFAPYAPPSMVGVQIRSGALSYLDGRVYIGNTAGFESFVP